MWNTSFSTPRKMSRLVLRAGIVMAEVTPPLLEEPSEKAMSHISSAQSTMRAQPRSDLLLVDEDPNLNEYKILESPQE
jgi:hypothetical protein